MDWIDMFMSYTEPLQVPKLFRLWSAISCVAAAAERKVFTRSYRGQTHPNLYVILAGAPGTGKGLTIGVVRRLLSHLKGIYLSPDDMTKAALLDELANAVSTNETRNGILISAPMAIVIREFGVFVPRYDSEFLNALTDLYDNPDSFNSARRTSTSVEIEKPTLNILAAVTPGYLGEIMPEVAWSQGFCSRFMFIYGTKSEEGEVDLFAAQSESSVRFEHLLPGLKTIREICGEFGWSEAARSSANAWASNGEKPVPEYSRLEHYNSRRRQTLMRLAMISALSANHELCVELEDVERALEWMIEAEEQMPNIFRAMGAKNDDQLLRDLHWYAYNIYNSVARDKRKPMEEQVLWNFLRNKTTSDRIPKLLEAAKNCGYFRQSPMGLWIPQDLSHTGGIE